MSRLILVCAHGKHNVCCARLGIPLAKILQDGFGDVVWETTHLGGDRYSANMVCLPHGLYYGDLAAVDGLTAAARYLVWLKRYRGRAGLAQPVQAAEHFLRSRTESGAVDAVTIVSARDADGAATEVVAIVSGERYLVRVEPAPLCPCGPGCAADSSTYVLGKLTSH